MYFFYNENLDYDNYGDVENQFNERENIEERRINQEDQKEKFVKNNILNNFVYLPRLYAEKMENICANRRYDYDYCINALAFYAIDYMKNILKKVSSYYNKNKNEFSKNLKNDPAIDIVVYKDIVSKANKILEKYNNISQIYFNLSNFNIDDKECILVSRNNREINFKSIISILHDTNALIAKLACSKYFNQALEDILKENKNNICNETLRLMIQNTSFKSNGINIYNNFSDDYKYSLFSLILCTQNNIPKEIINTIVEKSIGSEYFNDTMLCIIACSDYNILNSEKILTTAYKNFKYNGSNNINLIFENNIEDSDYAFVNNEIKRFQENNSEFSKEELDKIIFRINEKLDDVLKASKNFSNNSKQITKLFSNMYYHIIDNNQIVLQNNLAQINEIKNKIIKLPYGEQSLDEVKSKSNNTIRVKIINEENYLNNSSPSGRYQ